MTSPPERQRLDRERWRLVVQTAALLEKPMTVLAFVWLVLLILDLTRGLSPWEQVVGQTVWGVFILHFVLEFSLAPGKRAYLRRNWMTAIALMLPAVRVLRAVRAFRLWRLARATRPVGLLRLLASLNRGMRATRRALRRRGVGYVAALTALVVFGGAAGMFFFESPAALRQAGYGEAVDRGDGLATYGEAVWWTAMIITTMGSDYWPKTSEGRFLCWLLAVYAFAIFGYITATIASFFLGGLEPPPKHAPTLSGRRSG